MHPSTKMLILLGVVAVGGYAGWRWHDYNRAKEFRARRLAKQERDQESARAS